MTLLPLPRLANVAGLLLLPASLLAQSPPPLLQLPSVGGNAGAAVASFGVSINPPSTSVDFAVGAPAGNGRVDIWDPSNTVTPLRTHFGSPNSANFGLALDCRIDLTGDQIPDLIVGAPGTLLNTPPGPTGYVRLINGATGATVWQTLPRQPAANRFGYSVSATVDVNSDGVPDVVVGAPGTLNNAGGVSIVDGRSGAILYTVPSPAPGAMFGYSVRSGTNCDVDGDGQVDIIVGAPAGGLTGGSTTIAPAVGAVGWYTPSGGGATFGGAIFDPSSWVGGLFGCSVDYAAGQNGFRIYAGGCGFGASGEGIAMVLDPRAAMHPVSALAGTPGAIAGFSVRTAAADLDGDGFRDVLVGGPGVDAAALWGSAPASPLLVVVQGAAGTAFGFSVSDGLGIVPGLSSTLIGAPNFGAGAPPPGRTYVY